MKTQLQQEAQKALDQNTTTSGKLSAVLGVIDRNSPAPEIAGMVEALKFIQQYLDHPDVRAMNFALPASSAARMLREVTANLERMQAPPTPAPSSGPWYVASISAIHNQGLVCSEAGENIAAVYDAKNAPVIAAALDLLDALKFSLDPGNGDWRAVAQMAIAKAEGK